MPCLPKADSSLMTERTCATCPEYTVTVCVADYRNSAPSPLLHCWADLSMIEGGDPVVIKKRLNLIGVLINGFIQRLKIVIGTDELNRPDHNISGHLLFSQALNRNAALKLFELNGRFCQLKTQGRQTDENEEAKNKCHGVTGCFHVILLATPD